MSKSERKKSAVRHRIEKAVEAAEDEHRKKLLQQRLELARSGLVAFQRKQITDAVTAFHTYLKILEDAKNVTEGHLTPLCFDKTKEITELMVISGVYWDLAKLYDRATSANKQQEFFHYLEKYIVFSKGMPFQSFCAETMRKYISTEKPIHVESFQNAYRILASSSCFVVTSLADVTSPHTLTLFRQFRDQTLKKYPLTRSWIAWYYRRGPFLAQKIDRWPKFLRKCLGKIFDFFAYLIQVFTHSNQSRPESQGKEGRQGGPSPQ